MSSSPGVLGNPKRQSRRGEDGLRQGSEEGQSSPSIVHPEESVDWASCLLSILFSRDSRVWEEGSKGFLTKGQGYEGLSGDEAMPSRWEPLISSSLRPVSCWLFRVFICDQKVGLGPKGIALKRNRLTFLSFVQKVDPLPELTPRGARLRSGHDSFFPVPAEW